MKKTNKIVAIILAVLLVFSVFSVAYADDFDDVVSQFKGDIEETEKDGGFKTPANQPATTEQTPKFTGGSPLSAPVADVFTVIYDGNGAESEPPQDLTEYSDGDEVRVKANNGMAIEGKYFNGWNTKDTGSGDAYEPGDTFTITENTTLYAQWSDVTPTIDYRVDFDTDGKADEPPSQVFSTPYNTVVKPADPVWSSADPKQVFEGWYKDDACTTPWDFEYDTVCDSQPYTTEGDTHVITLYAKWGSTCTVSFVTGCDTKIADQKVEQGNTASKPTETLSKPGYEFTENWLDKDGNVYDFSDPVTDNMTLYADWEGNPYQIQFNYSTETPYTQDFTFGTKQALDPNTFEKSGSVFKGWTRTEGSTIVEYEDEEEVINLTTVKDAVIDFYAIFEEVESVDINYTVNDVTMGYVTPSMERLNPISGTAVGSTATALDGYEFVNWTDSEGTEVSTDETFVPEKTAGAYKAATYTANFQKQTFDVTFQCGIGATDVPEPQTVEYEGYAEKPEPDPKKTGYNFDKWVDKDGNVFDFANTKITEDTDIYAVWKPITYTVAFDNNTGEGTMNPIDCTYEVETTLPKCTFTKTGFNFAGWSTTEGGSVEYADQDTIKNLSDTQGAEVKLYAVWSEGTNVTITYKTSDPAKGSVSPTSESLAPATGVATGSTAVPAKGYKFKYWADKNGDKISTDINFVPTKSGELWEATTYTAFFTPKLYTITEDTCVNGSVDASKSVVSLDENFTVTATGNKGYHFKSWDITGDVTIDSPTEAKSNVVCNGSDVVVKATFEPNTYKVVYDANGGTGTTAQSDAAYDTAFNLTANGFTNEGYNFLGWSRYANAKTAQFEDVEEVINLSSINNGTVTLYAVWSEKDNVTIHFVSGDIVAGRVTVAAESLAPVQGISNGSEAVANYKYEFVNWTDSEGTEVSTDALFVPVKDGKTWKEVTYTANFNKVLANVYTDNVSDGFVKLDKLVASEGDVITVEAFPDEGYELTGITAVQGEITVNDDLKSFTVDSVDEDVIIAPVFEKKQLTAMVIAVYAGEAEIASETGVMGDTVTLKATPDKGYHFARWACSEGIIEDTMAAETTYTFGKDNDVISAMFIANEFEITFETNGGLKIDPQKVLFENLVSPPINPTKDGYNFCGWYADKELKTLYDFNKPVDRNFTLYAKWEKAPYTHEVYKEYQNQVWDGVSDLKVKTNDDYKNFRTVYVDQKEISPDCYTSEKGSIIVKLKADYLKTLLIGTHTLEIESTNGKAFTTFRIDGTKPLITGTTGTSNPTVVFVNSKGNVVKTTTLSEIDDATKARIIAAPLVEGVYVVSGSVDGVDNGEKSEEENVKTGDEKNIAFYITLAYILFGLIPVAFILRRKIIKK